MVAIAISAVDLSAAAHAQSAGNEVAQITETTWDLIWQGATLAGTLHRRMHTQRITKLVRVFLLQPQHTRTTPLEVLEISSRTIHRASVDSFCRKRLCQSEVCFVDGSGSSLLRVSERLAYVSPYAIAWLDALSFVDKLEAYPTAARTLTSWKLILGDEAGDQTNQGAEDSAPNN